MKLCHFSGLSHVVWAMGAFPGTTREECISKLKEGKLVLIAPGGLPECLKSSPKTYNFIWGIKLDNNLRELIINLKAIDLDSQKLHWNRKQ